MTAEHPEADPSVARFRLHVRELSAPGADDARVDHLPRYLARHPELSSVRIRELELDPHVPARLFLPPDAPRAGFVWAHGGSFIGGDLGMPESWWPALMLAARGVATLAIDYRKALHGVRYPAPSDDVLAAWRWAVASSGFEGTPVSFGGASAGACLVASATARAVEAGETLPETLVLVYPTLHAHAAPASAELVAATRDLPPDGRFPPELVLEMGRNYAGDDPPRHAFPGDDPVDPRMPPTLIVNSEADDLRASGEEYGRALRAAGVPCDVVAEPGTVHGHLNRPGRRGGVRTIERIAERLLAE